MKMHKVTNEYDRGTMRASNEVFSDYSFVECGLSLGVQGRSVFTQCTFSNIKIKMCSVGFPVFRQCHFENIVSDRNGILIYGTAFIECTITGSLKNVAIGFASEYVTTTPEQAAGAQKFQSANLAMATSSKFALDVTSAELEFVAFPGEAIIPYVRCARGQ